MTTTAPAASRTKRHRTPDLDSVMGQIRRAERNLRALRAQLKTECPYPGADATPAVRASWEASRAPIHARIDETRGKLKDLQAARRQIEARAAADALPLPTLSEIIERVVAVEDVLAEDRDGGYVALTDFIDWLEAEEGRALEAAARSSVPAGA